jgi:hypothetical protein
MFYDRLPAMLIVLESTTLCGALVTPRLFATTQTNRSGSVVEILWHPGDTRLTLVHQNEDEHLLVLEVRAPPEFRHRLQDAMDDLRCSQFPADEVNK